MAAFACQARSRGRRAVPTVQFLRDGDPWQDITDYFCARRRGKALCVISYIGPNGPHHLPLREGDVLVCNASDQAISSGATSPSRARSIALSIALST